jgi:hypothetical protein
VDASGGGIKHLVDRFRAHDRRGKAARAERSPLREMETPLPIPIPFTLAQGSTPSQLARYLDAKHKEEGGGGRDRAGAVGSGNLQKLLPLAIWKRERERAWASARLLANRDPLASQDRERNPCESERRRRRRRRQGRRGGRWRESQLTIKNGSKFHGLPFFFLLPSRPTCTPNQVYNFSCWALL